jgi:hypothetical protein
MPPKVRRPAAVVAVPRRRPAAAPEGDGGLILARRRSRDHRSHQSHLALVRSGDVVVTW